MTKYTKITITIPESLDDLIEEEAGGNQRTKEKEIVEMLKRVYS